jgi:hypothetical protein
MDLQWVQVQGCFLYTVFLMGLEAFRLASIVP